ncbi:hypothetical protein PMIN01_09780 [Paraphaeosphaeria minitans]|uniref:Uncharacterized protein n=1 Tax=Paraphaeosphaeria minitans TaxID=565426 RepID=A0A9P6GB13_9PLEO|nr:hypothetical protein PMIN01_09780 [Paraphaeosphaeria minitans]
MWPHRSRQEPAQIAGLARFFLPQRRVAQTHSRVLTLPAAEHSPSPCLLQLQTASHTLWQAPDVRQRQRPVSSNKGAPSWRAPDLLAPPSADAKECSISVTPARGSTHSPQPRNTAALLRRWIPPPDHPSTAFEPPCRAGRANADEQTQTSKYLHPSRHR